MRIPLLTEDVRTNLLILLNDRWSRFVASFARPPDRRFDQPRLLK